MAASSDQGVKKGYRSGLEGTVAKQLVAAGLSPLAAAYETERIPYVDPRVHHYTPDFPCGPFYVETKGRFLPEDRSKHLLIQAQQPHLDIRFVFSRSSTRISKTSKTTYADWCRKHGFKFADKVIPQSWLMELNK